MISPAGRTVRALFLGAVLAIGWTGTALAEDPSPSQPTNVQQVAPTGATLTAEPSVLTATVQPGGIATATLTLRAGRSMDITVEPQGLGQSAEDGSFTFLPAAEDVSPYSARPGIEVTPSSFRMEPGDARRVEVTIDLPDDATQGERFALLKVAGLPRSGDGNVGIGVALGVSVLVTMPGTAATITGAVRDLAVGDVVAGAPVDVTGVIENTGDTHYGAPPNQVYQVGTLRNASGDAIATTRGVLSGNSVIPTFGRQFQLAIDPGQALTPGEYSVSVEVGLEDGTSLGSATVAFTAAGVNPIVPSTAGPSDGMMPFLVAGLVGAAIAVLILLVVLGPRRLRRPSTS